MKPYQWILFDVDDTLFHFDSHRGLQLMCSTLNIPFTTEDYEEYEIINKALWIDYQNGQITAAEIRYKRFEAWANKLQASPHELNNAFMKAMAEICTPIDGAINLLNTLKNKVSLGIITNGFTELQKARVERMGLQDHFDVLVISEQVGIPKPHPGIFEHALNMMGNPAREKVLMVGDNPDSDIIGGINVGIDTCWLNRNNKPTPAGITPSYQVASLRELENLLSL